MHRLILKVKYLRNESSDLYEILCGGQFLSVSDVVTCISCMPLNDIASKKPVCVSFILSFPSNFPKRCYMYNSVRHASACRNASFDKVWRHRCVIILVQLF